jgi:predicted O-methyltransferase YrrM
MFVPKPVRSLIQFSRRKFMLYESLRKISDHSDALEPVRRALKRCIRGPDLRERRTWGRIEQRRQDIAKGDQIIDLGGQRTSLAAHGLSVSADHPWTDFLFQMTRVLRPGAILELGTNIGMSGSYMAGGLSCNGAGHLWTLEGVPDLAKAAQETFKVAGLSERATVVIGWFDDTLPRALSNGPFQLVFIDGHHIGDATVEFYRQIKPHLTMGSFIIFDDINWSRGMQLGWKTIIEDTDIRDHAVVIGFGIVAIH